jgi:DNA topoisomerase-2
MAKTKKQEVINIEDFFKESFTDFSAYASYRAIGSVIDGLKNSQRKVFYTLMHKTGNTKEKVSRLASIVGLKTEYLHGEASLESVIVTGVRHFDKPLPVLEEEGAFGYRTVPKAAASRYIYTKKRDVFGLIYNSKFSRIDGYQTFEGTKIEPRVLTPLLPMLLVNGNSGIGSGFSQNILPRNPQQIIDIITKYLKSKAKNKSEILSKADLSVQYPFFDGDIETEDKKSIFYGKIKIANTTTININELPIGYTIETYIKVLEGMIDANKIVSYIDKSNENNFNFVVKCKRNFYAKFSQEKLITAFKLSKSATENFVCVGEMNNFLELDSYNEILIIFMEFVINRYALLKAQIINDFENEIFDLSEKARFIGLVIKGKIIISNRKKEDIVKQLNKNKFKEVEIYLNMRIYSLTKEKYEELLRDVELLKKKLEDARKVTIESMYLKDIGMLQKIL